MIKNFCDLCGEPAAEWPTLRVDFPNIWWKKREHLLEGKKEPSVKARMVFEVNEDSRTYSLTPDLCHKCFGDLLRKMADTIK